MKAEKTTKQILKESARKERTPLYNQAAVKKIQADFERWRNTVVREQDRKNWTTTPHTIIGSDIPRELLYTPLNNPDLDYKEDLGFSGEEPYVRGVHPNMYRGRTFTMRQIFGAGSPEQCNKRMKMLLEHGATGTNWALDLATVQMFDSDEPEAKGQVATVGVPIDCVEDMEVICKDIPIDKISASIITHFPRNTAIIFPMYLVMAERRGISWDKLPGSSQNDFIMESVVRSAIEYIPPRDDFRVQCDNIEFMRKNVPQWNYVTLNGYNLREWGTSGITEMAIALCNGIEILKDMGRRGHDIDWAAERLAFFWAPANDFFEEVARIRAVRRLWYKIMKYRFEAKNPRSMWMRCHAQTSGVSLTREEPMNNIIRSAYQALAAVLGGVQSLHVDSFDEAYSVPSEEASIISLRTQQIIEAETQVTQVVDPLGGSFYVEALTNDIENRILDEVDEIEKLGGIIEVVASGWLRNKVMRHIEQEQRMIADGDIKVVGRNYYRAPDLKMPEVEVHEFDPKIARQMCDKLARLRQRRDNEKASNALKALVQACKHGDNVMQYTLECARADVTKGEMRRAFTEGFGSWKPELI
ncbi:MAG: methylmalonyl-CoA mutase family protein [Dehalococcoidales bacterium]|nr:methylmalonyl-CoA mutase family protein [Dehalococcoidales bacterium]